MLKLFLCLRYLRKKKIVLLSIAAVALSIALLMVVDSLFVGFVTQLKNADVRGLGDILFVPRMAPQYDAFLDELEKQPQIESAGPVLTSGGLLWLGPGDVRETVVMGVDARRESKDIDFRKALLSQTDTEDDISFDVPGNPNVIGGFVGIGLVAEPNEKTDQYDLDDIRRLIGKRVVLMISGQVLVEPETATDVPKWKTKRKSLPFLIADVFHSGVFLRDHTIYLPYDKLYKLVYGQSSRIGAQRIKIQVSQGAETASVKTEIWQLWEHFASEKLGWEAEYYLRAGFIPLEEEDSLFYSELRKQMSVLLLIFSVICSATILLIFCIFYMIVITRRKDIAILKSCGATNTATALIFLGFGACIGILGSVFGIILGYIVTTNINTIENWVRIVFGIKLWRSSVYMFERIPDQVDWSALWLIIPIAIAGCCVGSLIPAIVAARTKPIQILRYE